LLFLGTLTNSDGIFTTTFVYLTRQFMNMEDDKKNTNQLNQQQKEQNK